MFYCRHVQTKNFTFSKHFTSILVHLGHFFHKICLIQDSSQFFSLWSTADMSRQKILLFPKMFARSILDFAQNCYLGPRFFSKLSLWSIADISRQKISIFFQKFCLFKILHKIVILEHCGHKSFPVITHVTLTGKRVTPRHSKNWGSTGAAKTQAPGVYSIWQYKIPSKFVLFCFITHSSYKFSSLQKQTNKQTNKKI